VIQGLLLAAGNSKRFAGNKLLTSLPNSQTIAFTSAMRLYSAVDKMSVVVNPDHQPIIDLFLKKRLSVVSCALSQYGIGHSIACGVSETRNAQGWVIALADMPFIKKTTIDSIVNALQGGALLAAPVYGGKRGHPVGFSQPLYDELVQLKGDTGGKVLLSRYDSDVVEVPCQDAGIFIDIDTPEDFQKYSKEFGFSGDGQPL
jgi:molybdenum cofactor cytidylyltransferase